MVKILDDPVEDDGAIRSAICRSRLDVDCDAPRFAIGDEHDLVVRRLRVATLFCGYEKSCTLIENIT